MRRHLNALLSAALLLIPAACGAGPAGPSGERAVDAGEDAGGAPCDPATGPCRIELTARHVKTEGLALADGQERFVPTEVPTGGPEAPVDLSANLHRHLGLSGAGRDSICVVGEGFVSLADVPVDPASCRWSSHVLFGVLTDPYDGPAGAGRGLLVKDRFGEALYRVRVVHDDVVYDLEGVRDYVGTVVFDYERVSP